MVHRLWPSGLSRVSLGKLPFPEREDLQGMGRWMHAKSLQWCLICNPMTVACQAPLSMGFSLQEYWSGLPCPPPRDLPDSGIKPMSLSSLALAGEFFTTSATWGGAVLPFLKESLEAGLDCSLQGWANTPGDFSHLCKWDKNLYTVLNRTPYPVPAAHCHRWEAKKKWKSFAGNIAKKPTSETFLGISKASSSSTII